MANASTGGRYCSIMTVDGGKALVSERRIASTATAVSGWREYVTKCVVQGVESTYHQFQKNLSSSARPIPRVFRYLWGLSNESSSK